MTAGITSYGAYIPLHRLSRAEISRAWGNTDLGGEKAVANFDEDSLSMAVEAAIDCIKDTGPKAIDGLFLATTTSPYLERLGASIMAAALDMRQDIRTMDVTGSLRAGTTAFASALDSINAGAAKSIIMAASDCRLGAPAGTFEQALGDGAAALLLGEDDVIAKITESYSISDDFSGVWRAEGDSFVRSWEDRMVHDEGYSLILPEAISKLMKKCNLSAGDIAKVVYDCPSDFRRHSVVARKLGFDKSQLQDPMVNTVGITGAAMAIMMLVAALEEARAGDKILFATYGNGADAFVLEVTEAIEKVRDRRGIKNHLASKRMLASYQTYLRWRNLITLEAARRPERGPTSIAGLRTNRKQILPLYGVKCKKCGTPQYAMVSGGTRWAPARVCVMCQAKDEFEDYRFADKRGVIFSYTHDNLAESVDPPTTMVVVDYEGGGRASLDMTDRDPDQVDVGMPVEMTFRKLYSDRGTHNYYWKFRPIRC
ncbi:hydroxymethylglutaryl-CoA synthase family protein [Chloroflexota bacterium]